MPDLTGRSLLNRKTPVLSALRQNSMDIVSTTMTRLNMPNKTYNLKDNSRPNKDTVIDLTGEEADLQQAIKLSMECHSIPPNSNAETGEDDAAPVTDKKIPASSAVSYRNKSTPDPYKRRRISPDWPAGLKNLGNTCWFNSVIQSLFSLPIFRSIVLRYKGPENCESCNAEQSRNIEFMQELRNLFVLLVGSNQNYINPRKCVSQLKTGFEKDEKHQQQDVTEFTHKLLDLIEDAVSNKHTEHLSMEVDGTEGTCTNYAGPDANLLINLFYGEYKVQGTNNGTSFNKPHKFGLFPLCVDGVTTLHGSLENSTRDCSHLNQDGTHQEQWFTKLPPVLIFGLSRFSYNQASGAPEKIHSQFEFPHLLFMDRYMEANCENTRRLRKECDDLNIRLKSMKEELKKRRRMTVGEKSFLIQDMLKCCTEFAASKRKRYVENKRSSLQIKRSRNFKEGGSLLESDGGCGDAEPQHDGNADKEIEKASVVEECLINWMSELEQEKEDLRDEINSTQARIDSLYEDASTKKHPYDLHAVLVHQGLAAAGHYWAYVRDHKKCRWMKFNDTEVKESNWDELIGDSIGGGQGLTSAYCLMYIDRNRMKLLTDCETDEIIISSNPELQEILDKHNDEYASEMEEYDLERATILSLTSPECTKLENPEESPQINDADNTRAHEQQLKKSESPPSWNGQACMRAIKDAHHVYNTLGAEEATDHVLKSEWDRLFDLERQESANSDVRLYHVAVYMFRNKAPRRIIERTLLEQFADDRMSYDRRATEIMACAKERLASLSEDDLNDTEYQRWHRNYRLFCRATCCLLQGLEYWQKNKYQEAVPYLATVKLENDKLTSSASGIVSPNLLADWDLGLKTISLCLKKFHREAIKEAKKNDPELLEHGLNILTDFVIPWIHLLLNEPDTSDCISLLEHIRSEWCNLDVVPGPLQHQYESALQALMEPPTCAETYKSFHVPAVIKPQDLSERFKTVMSTISHR